MFDVCGCFLYICVRTDFAFFVDNLWFDDLRADVNRRETEHSF